MSTQQETAWVIELRGEWDLRTYDFNVSGMTSTQNATLPPPPQSSLSFTQGLLVGQLSVVLLIGAFIKFFIFGEAPPPPSRGFSSRSTTHRRSYSINNVLQGEPATRSLREKPSSSNILRPVPSSSTNTRSILRKTYYSAVPPNPAKNGRHRLHHSSHQPESLDWFNVLIAQTIAQYRQTAFLLKDSPTSSILGSLTETLNNPEKKPSFIDKITVTDISLGEEFPIFSNCRVIAVEDPSSDGGRLQALMDVDLSDDNLSLAIETSLILNYPKPFSAVLPVALAVSVVRFSGTLCISFVPGPTASSNEASPSPSSPEPRSETHDPQSNQVPPGLDPNASGAKDGDNSSKSGIPKTSLAFSFLPDYRLDLSVRSLIGSRSRLQDVPKVAQLVEARVQAWFEERVVEPRVQVVGLPGLWPRMGRTGVRGPEEPEVGSADITRPTTSASGGIRGLDGGIERLSSLNEVDVEGLRYRRSGGNAGEGIGSSGSNAPPYDNRSSQGAHREGLRMPGGLPDVMGVS